MLSRRPEIGVCGVLMKIGGRSPACGCTAME
jgi:hypothetical protein